MTYDPKLVEMLLALSAHGCRARDHRRHTPEGECAVCYWADKAATAEAVLAALKDPAAVWVNMLRGEIAIPSALVEVTSLRAAEARIAELEAALRPFANFADKFERMPLKGVDDTLYQIHGGTEHEAAFRLSDCFHALNALQRPNDD